MNATTKKPSKLTKNESLEVIVAIRMQIRERMKFRPRRSSVQTREYNCEIRTLISALRKLRHA